MVVGVTQVTPPVFVLPPVFWRLAFNAAGDAQNCSVLGSQEDGLTGAFSWLLISALEKQERT